VKILPIEKLPFPGFYSEKGETHDNHRRWAPPHLSSSSRGPTGGPVELREVFLVRIIMTFLVFLAASAPARVITPQLHGFFGRSLRQYLTKESHSPFPVDFEVLPKPLSPLTFSPPLYTNIRQNANLQTEGQFDRRAAVGQRKLCTRFCCARQMTKGPALTGPSFF